MAVETVNDVTGTLPEESRYMSDLDREQLKREMAVGTPLWVLASRYDRSYGHIKNLSSQWKEEIEEIRRQLGEEMNILWAQDLMYRAMELQSSLEKTRRQQRQLEEVIGSQNLWESEHWHKLDQHAAKLIHQLGEMLGQLPTRVAAQPVGQGRASIEIVGVDLDARSREWERQAEGAA